MAGGSASTPPGSRRRWVMAFTVGLLVAVLAAEGATRVVAARLPEPQDWVTPKMGTTVRDMDRIEAAGLTSDTVLVGTSMVGRGFAPTTLRDELGAGPVRKVAVEGAQATLIRRWLLEEVIPRLHPRRVVWGVSTLDFNGGRPDPMTDRYDAARATRRGALGSVDRLLEEASEVARHRATLREPARLAREVRRSRASRRPRPVAELLTQSPPALRPRRELTGDGVIRFIRGDMLAGFSPGTAVAELEAFRSTLLDLRRLGIETAVVVMPVSRTYLRAHPHGRRDYDAWLASVQEAAAGTGATLIDVHRSRPDADFPDNVHLAPQVAPVFTRAVARELAAAGWRPEP